MLVDQIYSLGLSHHTAPLECREALAHGLETSSVDGPAGAFDAGTIDNHEFLILSTCNRFELYARFEDDDDAEAQMRAYLRELNGSGLAGFADHLIFRRGEEVVAHLLRVASGLDSMILGESQVLGQVTSAYMQATEARTIGPVLDAIFRGAIRTGKRVRSQTAISRNPASISSIAISHAEKAAGDLRKRRVAVVGLGEMGQLALKSLEVRGIEQVSVVNRTLARAKSAAVAAGWHAYSLDELPRVLATSDVVMTATAAARPVITAQMVADAQMERPLNDALVLIDLAVPRDIEDQARNVPGARLIDIDELQTELDEALSARLAEVPRVEAMITDEMAQLRHELRTLSVRPLVVDLRQRAEAIRVGELERALRHLDDVDPAVLDQLHHLSRALVNRLFHAPTVRLKELAGNGESESYANAMRVLFDLESAETRNCRPDQNA